MKRRFLILCLLGLTGGCGDSGTQPRTVMVPFQLSLEGPTSMDGTVDAQTGARSCAFNLVARASGNFPLNRAYWTSASIQYRNIDSGQQLGTATWSRSQIQGFWGGANIGAGEVRQSETRDWSPLEVPGGPGAMDGSSFRITATFNYDFGGTNRFTGSQSFVMDCR